MFQEPSKPRFQQFFKILNITYVGVCLFSTFRYIFTSFQTDFRIRQMLIDFIETFTPVALAPTSATPVAQAD